MRKPAIQIKQTWLDKLVAWYNPERGSQRMAARIRMGMVTGGYTGADKSRRMLSSWSTTSGDADADTVGDLPTLRERSSDLVRNAPLAGGALNVKTTHVVGTGLRYKAQIDREFLGMSDEDADAWEREAEREFRLWAESPDCDVRRTLNFYGQQELVYRATQERGDAFTLLPMVSNRPGPYQLALQVIEADRVCNKNNTADTDTLVAGVERDNFGAPVNYHIARRHPGTAIWTKGNMEWDVVPAFGAASGRRNVIHSYFTLRPEQTRGVPELAPVIQAFKMLDDYTEAELTAAIVSGMFTVFVKAEGGASFGGDGIDTGTEKRVDRDAIKMGYGAVVDLGMDEEIQSANPGRPNAQFDPFVLAIIRQIGARLEVPFEIMLGHFTSSYSASRAAFMQAWKHFRMRRQWLGDYWCQPILGAWMTEAVARGRLYAPGFTRDAAVRAAYLGSAWVGPSPGQIDPLKEANANEIAEDRGWKTAAEITAEMTGGDWEAKHRQRVKEVTMRREGGLTEPVRTPAPIDTGTEPA